MKREDFNIQTGGIIEGIYSSQDAYYKIAEKRGYKNLKNIQTGDEPYSVCGYDEKALISLSIAEGDVTILEFDSIFELNENRKKAITFYNKG